MQAALFLLLLLHCGCARGYSLNRPSSSLSCKDNSNNFYKNGQVVSLSSCAVIFCANGEIKRVPLVDERFGCPHVEMVRKDGKCVNEAGDEIDHDVIVSFSDCVVDTCVYGGVKRLKSYYCEPDKELIDTSKVSEKWGLINAEVK